MRDVLLPYRADVGLGWQRGEADVAHQGFTIANLPVRGLTATAGAAAGQTILVAD